MPEGPEVETIRRTINDSVVGKKICAIWRSDLKLRTQVSKEKFDLLLKKRIVGLSRIGKILFLETGPNAGLMVQFGMSGKLLWVKRAQALDKHTHLRIDFEDEENELRFVDPRRFGDLFVYQKNTEKLQRIAKVGVDVFSLNEPVDSGVLKQFANSNRSIKVLLLDQKLVSGIGNIYASEALFRAKVSPCALGRQLSLSKIQEILLAAKHVVDIAVKNKGTSFQAYRDGNGDKGKNQENLKVFGKENSPCALCQKPICKIVQAQRSTFYCPKCQR